ncbi:cytochrome C [Veronia nyctiphanis]|uniref:Cytochrome C n=1 Tax=Veronia nyctiphanis TaxID=1278244 RepID=A0A4Q0YTJ3_9GAMM|nr:c-type cytochrome [Veronia nyctiphanis]RXJ74556.1 cytochrome C [Veronia nyctiphanis]
MELKNVRYSLIHLCLLFGSWAGYAQALNPEMVKAGKLHGAVCMGCHSVTPDSKVGIGPPLWNLPLRKVAGFDDYDYSTGLSEYDMKWTPETLDSFLTSPSTFSPGTKMVYPGVADEGHRLAIISWLATLSDKPTDWAIDSVDVKSLGSGQKIIESGAGMALVVAKCSGCHSLHLVKQQGLSRESWLETLEWMIDEQGMDALNDTEEKQILDYLSTHYGLETS